MDTAYNGRWFHNNWNWDSDGKFRKRESLEAEEEEMEPMNDLSDAVDVENIHAEDAILPITCHVKDGDYLHARCDYVNGEYNEFVKEITEPFWARYSDCMLSGECNLSFDGYAVDPKCTCTCDGELTSLRDPRCEGFAGSLPTPPHSGAHGI
ncbi:hypothetical protein H112_04429 [Trichophyton rubrum D6]|uniref:Uncharacterized protein n=4 Tax=Trichophyton TaxID=5550 RepID=A0A178F3N5_TRIRU|nr:hypothetical protein H100_04438 [Trichophyton rubrum MR850]EZF41775.1 hypothetical protein H102_04422 [Trichophyton rubrum CBS 100081]EZF52468.1 hypothetical protein H103_04432 [Trichophyton rubrum CBS 288.86]EZF63051.1 hypothetical protein H104_04421 [Trichophyton rubrum CBS 289.86]EZF73802.1 hypothetical protein H105_04447 [Trichophyton soudanense CBS 452.61]EZF84357.1 hypothetical protein H110_04424 [Trichophyton rubrum MR1448]EZF95150.1 hypothetical protein H113_04465 [Trichophyton rub